MEKVKFLDWKRSGYFKRLCSGLYLCIIDNRYYVALDGKKLDENARSFADYSEAMEWRKSNV